MSLLRFLDQLNSTLSRSLTTFPVMPRYFGYAVILGAGLATAAIIQDLSAYEYETALRNYRAVSLETAAGAGRAVESSLKQIYQNIRTISLLPSAVKIDRHGTNLDADGRESIQQIYNNLASNVAVSEVYIVPVDFDPAAVDPRTGKPEEPIVMFDELIANAAQRRAPGSDTRTGATDHEEEIEIHEYRQLQEHLAWFKQHYPTNHALDRLNIPFFSGPEIIICDNTVFNTTKIDADRRGILFSVPLYGTDGILKGSVTAILRTSALRTLLPERDAALINVRNGFVAGALDAGQQEFSGEWVRRGEADPGLIFSAAIPVAIDDRAGPWQLWVGHANDDFLNGREASAIPMIRYIGFGICGFMTLVGVLMSRVIRRRRSAELTKLNTELADNVRKLEAVNAHATSLNTELLAKMAELKAAQDDIVKKGKLAQLGQLTATVAHEIRNPLGAIKTSTQLVERKVRDKNLGLEKLLERINNGVSRCDQIITELLDFARSKSLQVRSAGIDAWVRAIVEEEARSLPPSVQVSYDLGLGDTLAAFDPECMRRVLVNLLSNAAEAMVGKGDARVADVTHAPMIRVSTRMVDGKVEIAVKDNGPGIAEDNIKKILEPLFTTKSFGVGLGLPAVEKVLEHHGGGLRIESRPGGGATFTAWFPIGHVQAMAA